MSSTSFRDDKSSRHSSITDQSQQISILNRRPFCLEQLASVFIEDIILTLLLVNSYRPSLYMSLCCVCRPQDFYCNAPLVCRSYSKRGTTKLMIMIMIAVSFSIQKPFFWLRMKLSKNFMLHFLGMISAGHSNSES